MLLALEGFDLYESPGQMIQRSGYLQWTTVGASPSLVAGRIDGTGKAFAVTGNGQGATASLASNMQAGFIGFGVKVGSGGGSSGSGLMAFYGKDTNANADQFNFSLNGIDSSITHPGGRTVNNLFPLDTWFHLEIGFAISTTGGSLIVRINGANVLTYTGKTQNGPNAWLNGFYIGARDFVTTAFDDLYICDTVQQAGAHPFNTFLGDRRIYTLLPTGPGDRTEWSPLSGTNYSQVAVNGDDAGYNFNSTVGAEDLFNMADLPSSVTEVLAVQVTGRYKKLDAASHTLTQRIKSGGVDAPGVGFLAPYALSTSYVYYSDVFPLDPSTNAAWTLNAVNAIQVGYRMEG